MTPLPVVFCQLGQLRMPAVSFSREGTGTASEAGGGGGGAGQSASSLHMASGLSVELAMRATSSGAYSRMKPLHSAMHASAVVHSPLQEVYRHSLNSDEVASSSPKPLCIQRSRKPTLRVHS